MTKFGEASRQGHRRPRRRGRASRAGRRRRDDEGHRRPRRRQPDGPAAAIGQQLQKQIGQTGIPVYNVSNACATGATALRTAIMARQGRRVSTWAWRSASRSSPAPACSVQAARPKRTSQSGRRQGRYGAVATDRRAHRHRHDAGRVRPGRHGVRPQVRRHELRAVRQDQREEPRPLDAQPARRLLEAHERSTRS